MKDILLCSADPILVKSLMIPLMQDGYIVDKVEHTSEAIRKFMDTTYRAVILDTAGFGIPAPEAALVIKHLCPSVEILIIGTELKASGIHTVQKPVETDSLRSLLRYLLLKGGFYDAQRNYSNSI